MHTTSHPLKPLLALALAGGIVISSLSACGGESGSSPDISDGTTSADAADTLAEAVTTEPEETLPADNLPDTDLSGYTFRIYSLDECAKFFYSDTLDGDVVNDAIYQSIMNVEERFGADVQCVIFGSGDGDFNGAINKIILAGDDVFDVAENHDTLSGDSSLKGLYLNILDFPYLDFDQPWYPTNAIDSLTLYGKLFLFSSAMSYKGLHQTRILYMNRKLLDDYGIESPYPVVFDGAWTLDRLMDITRDTYQDLNSNQQVDEEDFFGFTTHQYFDGWMEAFDLNALTKNDAGELVIGINNQRTADIVDKMYSWIVETNDTFIAKKKLSESDIFTAERSIITYGEISTSYMIYRNTEVDYGMLPYPKFDENQSDYISFYTDRFFVVPKTAQNTDNIGFMLEALSSEGYRTIYPAYYEIALKVKYTHDDESVRILDIINDSRMLSFTYVYDNSNLRSIFSGMLNASKPNHDFASYYAKGEKAALKRIDKINEAYQNN